MRTSAITKKDLITAERVLENLTLNLKEHYNMHESDWSYDERQMCLNYRESVLDIRQMLMARIIEMNR